jgi:hypothetical protein
VAAAANRSASSGQDGARSGLFRPPELGKRFGRAELARLHVGSLARGLRERRRFADVEAFCIFVGYPRSGHSLVGALLDAHPEIVIAHELDVLKYVDAGFRRIQLFELLLANSRRIAASGREQTGYSYAVPGQWQGRFQALRVIGDKKGGMSTFRLRDDPGGLERLTRRVHAPLRVIHVVRNPYDNIATMSRRRDTRLPRGERDRPVGVREAAGRYFSLCETVTSVTARLPASEVFHLRHEDLIAAPAERLRDLCGFLGRTAPDDYLDDCAAVVFGESRRSRDGVEWSAEEVELVAREIARFGFLMGYTFDS